MNGASRWLDATAPPAIAVAIAPARTRGQTFEFIGNVSRIVLAKTRHPQCLGGSFWYTNDARARMHGRAISPGLQGECLSGKQRAHLAFNRFRLIHRTKPFHHFTISIDQELGEVPLDGFASENAGLTVFQILI